MSNNNISEEKPKIFFIAGILEFKFTKILREGNKEKSPLIFNFTGLPDLKQISRKNNFPGR